MWENQNFVTVCLDCWYLNPDELIKNLRTFHHCVYLQTQLVNFSCKKAKRANKFSLPLWPSQYYNWLDKFQNKYKNVKHPSVLLTHTGYNFKNIFFMFMSFYHFLKNINRVCINNCQYCFFYLNVDIFQETDKGLM